MKRLAFLAFMLWASSVWTQPSEPASASEPAQVTGQSSWQGGKLAVGEKILRRFSLPKSAADKVIPKPVIIEENFQIKSWIVDDPAQPESWVVEQEITALAAGKFRLPQPQFEQLAKGDQQLTFSLNQTDEIEVTSQLQSDTAARDWEYSDPSNLSFSWKVTMWIIFCILLLALGWHIYRRYIRQKLRQKKTPVKALDAEAISLNTALEKFRQCLEESARVRESGNNVEAANHWLALMQQASCDLLEVFYCIETAQHTARSYVREIEIRFESLAAADRTIIMNCLGNFEIWKFSPTADSLALWQKSLQSCNLLLQLLTQKAAKLEVVGNA